MEVWVWNPAFPTLIGGWEMVQYQGRHSITNKVVSRLLVRDSNSSETKKPTTTTKSPRWRPISKG